MNPRPGDRQCVAQGGPFNGRVIRIPPAEGQVAPRTFVLYHEGKAHEYTVGPEDDAELRHDGRRLD